MSVKLFSVKTFDLNGEDWVYTVCAEDPTEAAVLALESRLENELEGEFDDLRGDSCGNVEVTTIATLGSFDKVGVVTPGMHIELPVSQVIDLIADRREMGALSI